VSQYAELPWSERVMDRLGHHAVEVLILAVAATIVLGLHPLPGALSLTVPLAVVGVVVLAWVAMRRHDRRLCEACMSAMPLNASEQATHYRKRFWTAHNLSDRRFLLPYLVVLVGSNFATTTTIGRLGWALVQSSMLWLIVSYATHRRLQPWCPWCSDGGGGEHVEDTPPVLPHDDRLLV
jgi:hypothetical protein